MAGYISSFKKFMKSEENKTDEVGANPQMVQEEGATIHKLSDEERAEAIAKTAIVYEQFKDMFTAGLVNQIKAAK